jgi:hypothetical protein
VGRGFPGSGIRKGMAAVKDGEMEKRADRDGLAR